MTKSHRKENTEFATAANAHSTSKSSGEIMDSETPGITFAWHIAKKTTGNALRYFAKFTRWRSRLSASGAWREVMMHWRARIRKGNAHAAYGSGERLHWSNAVAKSALPAEGPLYGFNGKPVDTASPRTPNCMSASNRDDATIHEPIVMSKNSFDREVRPSATRTSTNGISREPSGHKQRQRACTNGSRQRLCFASHLGSMPPIASSAAA
mmetsp:Transcript_47250/g.110510  ORF Transcript_47250/g.110510 Transcript_47250/m.110510 type:complete len:210 (-) Transcript_47250:379-1008(-)